MYRTMEARNTFQQQRWKGLVMYISPKMLKKKKIYIYVCCKSQLFHYQHVCIVPITNKWTMPTIQRQSLWKKRHIERIAKPSSKKEQKHHQQKQEFTGGKLMESHIAA